MSSLLTPYENSFYNGGENTLSPNNISEKKEIKEGMSPSEIAEIISDRLIELIKQDFDKVKEKLNT